MVKEIRNKNGDQFLLDIRRVREVLVYAKDTREFFKITKQAVKEAAAERKITYYMTDKIFVVRRTTMVII